MGQQESRPGDHAARPRRQRGARFVSRQRAGLKPQRVGRAAEMTVRFATLCDELRGEPGPLRPP